MGNNICIENTQAWLIYRVHVNNDGTLRITTVPTLESETWSNGRHSAQEQMLSWRVGSLFTASKNPC